MSFNKKAQEFFKENPLVSEVNYTSDGFAFMHKPDALAHSATLEDKEIETFSNSTEEVKVAEEKPTVKAPKKAEKTEEEIETQK